ncbi:MAG: hypothetical protein Q8O19_02110, partial [Rectinemataceae bacterium]|nr:hypothetical protein [Rectinemataceae bacterium]
MELHQLFRVLSILLALISGFIFVCLVFALAEREPLRMLLSYAIPSALSLVSFLAMYILTRKDEKPYLSNKAGLLFVTLGWLTSTCLGALPFLLSGYVSSFSDALYETMSGFDSTGASI